MTALARSYRSNAKSLLEAAAAEFQDAHLAYDLFEQLLDHRTYDKSFCKRLLEVADGKTPARWETRRLAVLMLEHQVLKLEPRRIQEFDFLLGALGLRESARAVAPSVLREGYTTTSIRGFISELQRKLARLNRVHDPIVGRSTTENALRDFVSLSRRDCKLSLARYLFTPEEVAQEILRRTEVTDGVKDLNTEQPWYVDDQLKSELSSLPDFERSILKRLCESSNIYWVSEATSSEIHSLVEYPASTVVLVVKPPGSHIEFELKRAGRRGPNPLNVVFARNGYTVPPSHRLDGGCMQGLLRYETNGASKLALIYRLVHGVQAPIPSYVSRSTIYSVPSGRGPVQTLSYFAEPQIFGDGFRRMRAAMSESIEAFKAEGNAVLPELPGDLGLSAGFIGHVAPAQSILCGTTSFRLDRLAWYLSSKGPAKYFKEGLRVPFTKQDEKRLADELLEEALGVYEPPDSKYQTYEKYLEAALGVNRARAERVYLSLVQQIAKFWGTLLGVRGFSRGESFVPRNVGLRSVWDEGEWTVKIIFMDHDALSIPAPDDDYFYIPGALPCMRIDERYVWDRTTEQRFTTSEVGYLQRIYRVSKEIDAKGQQLADRALRDSYLKTQDALLSNKTLQSLFSPKFIERLRDWDAVVDGCLKMKHRRLNAASWKRKMKRMLDAKGYQSVAIDSYIELFEQNREFLSRFAHLFRQDTTRRRSRDYNAAERAAARAVR